MANTTIKITQLPSIGNGLSATTILPVVDTTGTAITAKVPVGSVGNLILTEAGNTLEPAFLSTLAYSVANAAQPNITSVGTLSVSTLKISGGDNGYVLQTDGAGNLAWVAGGGSGNGEVGGANTQIQFNDAGNFGGDPELTWDAGNNKLITANLSASGNANVGNVNTVNVNATGNLRPNAIYTDNYFYANGYVFGGSGNGSPGGANTEVQFNNNGAFGGEGNFTYDSGNHILSVTRANVSYLTAYTSIIGGNSVTANYFIGSGANLTNIAGANVGGFVPNANVANTAFAVAAANVIGLGNIATISLSGSTSNVLYGNGVFAPASGGGNANTGNVTFDNINVIGTGNLHLQPDPANANSGSYLDIFLTSGPDIHLVASANANLILGKDNGANVMTSWDGNAYIQAWDGSNASIWTFGQDGGTVFPTLDVQRGDNPSGTITGQTLLFSDASQEAIISTADGTVSNENSQRLVINPGQGYDYGEGGDIYLWAGRGGDGSGSGGDIKIRGGQGGANTTGGIGGSGGYIRIEAGDSATTGGSPGYVDINGGNSATAGGGYVEIYGGQGATVGGDANLKGGYGYTERGGNVNIWGGGSANGQINEGLVNIQTGGYTWTYDSRGSLTLPSSTGPGSTTGYIQTANGYPTLLAYGSGSHGGPELDWMDSDDPANTFNDGNVLRHTMYLNDEGLYIGFNTNEVANTYIGHWLFDPAGNLILPGNTFSVNYANGQQVNISGGGGNTGNVTFSNVTIQGDNNVLNLSAGADFTANLAYLQLRAGDVASHIHLDTGNNNAYDLIVGNDDKFVQVSSTGNIVMSSYDGNTSYEMTLDTTGNLILAGGNSVIQSIANSSSEPLYPNVSTMVFTPDALLSSQSLVLDPTGPSHIHLRAPGANIDEPDANIFLGGEESSFEVGYYNGNVPNLYIHSNNNTWMFDIDGNITFPRDGSNISTDPYLKILGGPSPQILSEDASLAGPANLAIVTDYLNLSGATGNRIILQADAGAIATDAAIVLSTNLADLGNVYSWTLDTTGNLSLPAGGSIYSEGFTPSGNPGNTITLNPHGSGSITNQKLLVYPTAADGDHIHMTSGNLYETELFLGSDNLYVKLANTGNVVINSNDGNISNAMWTFGTNGNLTLPGNLVINGLTNILGTNVALLASNPDLPLLSLSSGSNGGVSSLWVEDGGNIGTSNIAAVYVNPTVGSKIVRIAVGQNGGNAGPNLWDFNANGTTTFPGDLIGNGASPAPNISGFSSVSALEFTNGNGNVTINANSNIWKFSSTGNLTLPGNTFAVNYANGTQVPVGVTQDITSNGAMSIMLYDGNIKYNNYATVEPSTGNIAGNNISASGNISANNFTGNGGSLSNVATKTTGSWTLAPGVNTVSLSVPINGTYSIWVNGNIPNGIVTYTATAVVTNTNVPVLGSSYGWYYAAGNALVLTSIPTQFVGTVNNISNAVVSTTTANVFTFGITNNSGASQVVNWGYTKL